jgi:hypothetical protein
MPFSTFTMARAHEAKNMPLDWQAPRGWIQFYRFKQVAAELELRCNPLTLTLKAYDYQWSDQFSLRTALALEESVSNMQNSYAAIRRMPTWSERTHAADELGINDVLAALFLGLARLAANDSFTLLRLLHLLQTLAHITPAILICHRSQRFCEDFFGIDWAVWSLLPI